MSAPVQPLCSSGALQCTSPFRASQPHYDTWLLACALHAHPAEELPVADLLALPELLPFGFQVAVGDLRASPYFSLERRGGGLDMVRLAHAGRRD